MGLAAGGGAVLSGFAKGAERCDPGHRPRFHLFPVMPVSYKVTTRLLTANT